MRKYKILLGIPTSFSYLTKAVQDTLDNEGLIKDFVVEDEADYWCDFSIEYNIDEEYYNLSFETCIGFETKEECRNWIIICLDKFTEYMEEKGYDTSKELDLYQVFTKGINVNSHFKTIEDAYAFMKFVVNGFHGDGM